MDIELVEAEASVRVLQWIRAIAAQIGAEIIVTDDADALKTVADELGCQQQICRAHVNRNVHDLAGQLGTKALEHPDQVLWEMPGMTVEQFLEDLGDLEWIIKSVPQDGQARLDQLRRAIRWRRLRPKTTARVCGIVCAC